MKKTNKTKNNQRNKILLIILSITVVFIIVFSFLGFCAFSANRLVNSIVDNTPVSFEKYFGNVQKCSINIPLVDDLPDILGDKTY